MQLFIAKPKVQAARNFCLILNSFVKHGVKQETDKTIS